MEFLLLLPLLLLPLILLLLRKPKWQNQQKPNFPPSPTRLPLVGNLHQLGELPHQSLSKLSQQHGSVMFLKLGSVPTLVVSSAETAEQVLRTHDLHFCSRPSLVGPRRLTYDSRDIAFSPYGEYWREMRKVCVVELFSVKRVQSFGFIRAEEISTMIHSISTSTQLAQPMPIDLSKCLMSAVNHIICRVAFGKDYRVKDDQFGDRKFDDVVSEAAAMLGCFSAMDFFPSAVGWVVDKVSGLHGRLEKVFKELDDFYQEVIDEHVNKEKPKLSNSEHEDIVDVLLRLEKDGQAAAGGFQLTKVHIKAILMDIFLGGVDTSVVTMVWAMTELARKPEAMKKVQEEIRGSVGRKGKVDEDDLEQLEYLKMVVKETLRLHPPGTLLIPRESMQQTKINGFDVLPGTRILVNVWAIGRSPSYWEKPEEFIPERFSGSSIDFRGQCFEFLPFGGGRRGCPGITMGVKMVELAIANLLYSFDWELPEGMRVDDIDMDEAPGIPLHKKSALHLVPIRHEWKSDEQKIMLAEAL